MFCFHAMFRTCYPKWRIFQHYITLHYIRLIMLDYFYNPHHVYFHPVFRTCFLRSKPWLTHAQTSSSLYVTSHKLNYLCFSPVFRICLLRWRPWPLLPRPFQACRLHHITDFMSVFPHI